MILGISNRERAQVISLIILGILSGILWFLSPGGLFIILSSAVLFFLLWRFTREEDRKFVLGLFFSGLLLRILLGSVLHFLSLCLHRGYVYYPDLLYDPLIKDRYATCFIGDSAVTSLRGWWLAQVWHEVIKPEWFHTWDFLYSPFDFHFIIYAVLYYFFGFAELAGKFINSIFSMGAAILIYYIAKDIFDKRIARIAAVFAAFFPSIVLWSVTDLKEPVNSFLFCLAIFSVQRFLFLYKFRYLFFLLISFLNIFIRYRFGLYIIGFSLFSIAISFLRYRALRLAAIPIIALIIIMPWGRQNVSRLESALVSVVNTTIVMQQGAASSGNTSYTFYPDSFARINSIFHAFSPVFLVSVSKSIAYFLLAPFPWQMRTFTHFAVYPQILIWDALFGMALFGVLISLRFYFKKSIILLAFSSLCVTLSAMASGNIGSAFRHRDIVTPLILIFSAAGIERLFFKGAKNQL